MTTPSNLADRPFEKVVPIESRLVTWLAVHGYLCMALRHPALQDVTAHPSRGVVQSFVDELGELLVLNDVLTPEELQESVRLEEREIIAQACCERCGCTEVSSCPGGCSWNEEFLRQGRYVCTSCAPASRIITLDSPAGGMEVFW